MNLFIMKLSILMDSVQQRLYKLRNQFVFTKIMSTSIYILSRESDNEVAQILPQSLNVT